MTIFYSDQFNGIDLIRDEEGEEFDDLSTLRREATLAVRELILIAVGFGEAIGSRELRIRTAAGPMVMTVAFKDTLGIDPV